MSSTILFDIAIITICGLLFGRLAKFVRMPNVTGYLIAGLVLGPCLLNVIPENMVSGLSVVSDMALGFIAFSIGSQFKMSYFKEVGWTPIVIAITESVGAVLFVTLTLIVFGVNLQLSILLGAIAAATAPAQTISVINQYQAKGSLTSMLLSVVALDDAVALICFGFATTIVKVMGTGSFTVLSVLQPFYEILISFVIGAAAGLLMTLFFRWFKKPNNRLCVVVGFVMASTWTANTVGGSALLTCMALGAMLANIFDDIENVLKVTDSFTPPLFMIFFVVSGAGFDVKSLAGIGFIGIIYVIMRVIGKIIGAYLGGRIMKADSKICKYLGPTLMPQAGVALGLLMVAAAAVPQYAKEIRTIILCSTFIYSIAGPVAAKAALVKSGEIVLPAKS